MRPLSRKRRKWKDQLLARYPGQVFCLGGTRNGCIVRVIHGPKQREDLEYKVREGMFFCASRVSNQKNIYRLAFAVAQDAIWIVWAGQKKANAARAIEKQTKRIIEENKQPQFKLEGGTRT